VQKVMFAAILVGMVGVYAMHEFGWINLHIDRTQRSELLHEGWKALFSICLCARPR
jgi:hypothetical protein